jgi:hypothetical protein
MARPAGPSYPIIEWQQARKVLYIWMVVVEQHDEEPGLAG